MQSHVLPMSHATRPARSGKFAYTYLWLYTISAPAVQSLRGKELANSQTVKYLLKLILLKLVLLKVVLLKVFFSFFIETISELDYRTMGKV